MGEKSKEEGRAAAQLRASFYGRHSLPTVGYLQTDVFSNASQGLSSFSLIVHINHIVWAK